MQSVEQNITELLYRHNCVIIPEFGAFVGNYAEAKVDERRGLIYPPSKDIIFNKNIVRNDGLLINKIQENTDVSELEAKEQIQTFIDAVKSNLKEKGRFEIPKLGILYFDQEQNIQFEQDRFANLLLGSFGLGSVKFVKYDALSPKNTSTSANVSQSVPEKQVEVKPVQPKQKEEKKVTPVEVKHKEQVKFTKPKEAKKEEENLIQFEAHHEIEPVKEEVQPEKKSVDKDEKVKKLNDSSRKRFPWGRVAAALIVLPLAFYSYWIPFKTEVFHTGYISVNDFNPLNQKTERIYSQRNDDTQLDVNVASNEERLIDIDEEIEKLPETVHYYSLEVNKNLYIPIDLGRKIAPSKDVSYENEYVAGASFHLIVGCFGDKSNANGMVNDLKSAGFDAAIVDKNKGLYRVSAGGFDRRSDIESARSKAKSQGYKGWILKK